MDKNVLVVGGSDMYIGAPYLAGISALRSGAGSVIITTPEKVAWAINTLSPDLVTLKLSGNHLSPLHIEDINKKLSTADILIIGNGAGLHEETKKMMLELMKWDGIKVVDADALKIIKNNEISNSILTPNIGEWEILEKNNDIKRLTKEQNVVIIQKGNPTKIHYKNEIITADVNLGLHKAGTGDVLAGLCAGYLGQGLSLKDAAIKATSTSNEIADILTEKKQGYYFLASDIVSEIEKLKLKKP